MIFVDYLSEFMLKNPLKPRKIMMCPICKAYEMQPIQQTVIEYNLIYSDEFYCGKCGAQFLGFPCADNDNCLEFIEFYNNKSPANNEDDNQLSIPFELDDEDDDDDDFDEPFVKPYVKNTEITETKTPYQKVMQKMIDLKMDIYDKVINQYIVGYAPDIHEAEECFDTLRKLGIEEDKLYLFSNYSDEGVYQHGVEVYFN